MQVKAKIELVDKFLLHIVRTNLKCAFLRKSNFCNYLHRKFVFLQTQTKRINQNFINS